MSYLRYPPFCRPDGRGAQDPGWVPGSQGTQGPEGQEGRGGPEPETGQPEHGRSRSPLASPSVVEDYIRAV